MDSLNSLLAHMPKAAVATFAVIGFIFVADRSISYIRLLLSLFVLKGTNVSFALPKLTKDRY